MGGGRGPRLPALALVLVLGVAGCASVPERRPPVVAGVPLGTPGATNMLRIAFVGDDSEDL